MKINCAIRFLRGENTDAGRLAVVMEDAGRPSEAEKIKHVGAVRLQQVGDTAAALGTGFQGRIWAEKTFNDARADNGTVSNLPILIT